MLAESERRLALYSLCLGGSIGEDLDAIGAIEFLARTEWMDNIYYIPRLALQLNFYAIILITNDVKYQREKFVLFSIDLSIYLFILLF